MRTQSNFKTDPSSTPNLQAPVTISKNSDSVRAIRTPYSIFGCSSNLQTGQALWKKCKRVSLALSSTQNRNASQIFYLLRWVHFYMAAIIPRGGLRAARLLRGSLFSNRVIFFCFISPRSFLGGLTCLEHYFTPTRSLGRFLFLSLQCVRVQAVMHCLLPVQWG